MLRHENAHGLRSRPALGSLGGGCRSFLDFPGSVPNFQQVSGGGTLLDAVPAFTTESIYHRLDAYGDDERTISLEM